ncbi:hypothetical protein GY45DRAFT_1341449 [Cubamyces sp. BRFM 1775]|nr:hypothetical protein GY45DRAFT_1341449 [Cubamyces sp. BRFM 1775]
MSYEFSPQGTGSWILSSGDSQSNETSSHATPGVQDGGRFSGTGEDIVLPGRGLSTSHDLDAPDPGYDAGEDHNYDIDEEMNASDNEDLDESRRHTTQMWQAEGDHAGLAHRVARIERRQDETDSEITRLWDKVGAANAPGHEGGTSVGRSHLHLSSADNTCTDTPHRSKDSTGNYIRSCVRAHIQKTFGFTSDGSIPPPPGQEFQSRSLQHVASGKMLRVPFMYDWSSPPSTAYNLCVEDAFCIDFWAHVMSGEYALAMIPLRYQGRQEFVKVVRTHISTRRRQWSKAQQGPLATSDAAALARQSAAKSRTGTTLRNRRSAASHIPDPRVSAKAIALIDLVGSQGISSDEEVTIPGHYGKSYAVFSKPWRPPALVNVYRHLDMVHAATRNPIGNPIRTRYLTANVRSKVVVPKFLPIDCYDPLYLQTLSDVERHLLQPKPAFGVEELCMNLRALGLQ